MTVEFVVGVTGILRSVMFASNHTFIVAYA